MKDPRVGSRGGLRLLLASFVRARAWTGMGKWTFELSAALEGLGHRPTLWFEDDFPKTARIGRLAVLAFPVVLAGRIVRERRAFDAVIVHEPSGGWYGLMRKLIPSLPPMVVMCHNVEAMHFEEMLRAHRHRAACVPPGTRIKSPLFRLWQSRMAIAVADHVVCLSGRDEQYILSTLGRSGRDVTRLVNGVHATAANGQPAGGSKRVLFVGGWLDVKGRRVLPRLWRSVRRSVPDATLTLVGTGAAEPEVLACFDAKDQPSIAVRQRVEDPAELARAYVSHAVLLMPSVSEGSPLALLEAMAAGLPVVASRVGGIPDIVTDGADGLLFDPFEPEIGAALLVRVLRDHGLARQLGRAARARTRSLSWTATARGLIQAVAAALSSQSRGQS